MFVILFRNGSALLKDPTVLFAGYKVPHPLRPYFLLKIQTDGSCTPQEALDKAATGLISTIENLSQKFAREFDFAGAGAASAAGVGLGAGVTTGGAGEGGLGGAYGDGSAWSGKDYLDL